MKKRYKMSKRNSKRYFSKSAGMSHKKNFQARPMRGGIRL
jgi:hypothetical protein